MTTDPFEGSILDPSTIGGWLSLSRGREISTDVPMHDARLAASRILSRLVCITIPETDRTSHLPERDLPPDVCYALVELVEGSPSGIRRQASEKVFALLDSLEWSGDLFNEKSRLKGRLAYQAWLSRLSDWNYPELIRWQHACVECLDHDEVWKELKELPLQAIPLELHRYLLGDPLALLAKCVILSDSRNRDPATAIGEAQQLYDLLCSHGVDRENRDDASWVLGELALSVAVSCRHLGIFALVQPWVDSAKRHFGKLRISLPWLMKAEGCRLTALHDARQPQGVLVDIDRLISGLASFGMSRELARIQLLKVVVLRLVGQIREAQVVGQDVKCDSSTDPDLAGQLLIHLAEMKVVDGDVNGARALLEQAYEVGRSTGSPMIIAHLLATVGEVNRSEGLHAAAVESYRGAVITYQKANMLVYAGYLRLLLAGALLDDGRSNEAAQEVLRALPILERERMLPDIAHAIVLLRRCSNESVSDPTVLAQLRAKLQQWQ